MKELIMEQLLYLNRFTAIVEQDNKYFFEINSRLGINWYEVKFSFERKKNLEQMLEGNGFAKNELIVIWGEKTIEHFIHNGILLSSPQDIKYINSRTNAYFQFEHINNSAEILARKKVMILGCGGIGTHVAWNLAAMGVGSLILVDFDVVELTNLNRQLLFDIKDVGKYKVNVLKEKLSLSAPDIKIFLENKKISSEEQIEELCRKYNCDLIIKTLDSPEEFPIWFDRVCKRLKVNYVSGTLSGTYFVIGPTYIASENCVGYSDIFTRTSDYKIISGIRPSVSCQVSQSASLIVSEACRVLLNLKNLKYKNKVFFHDPILQTSMELIAKEKKIEVNEDEKWRMSKNLLFFSMCLLVLTFLFHANYLLWGGGMLLLFGAIVIFTVPSRAAMAVAINSIQYYFVAIFAVIIQNKLLITSRGIIVLSATLLNIFILYSIIILITTVCAYVLTYCKNKAISAIKGEQYDE